MKYIYSAILFVFVCILMVSIFVTQNNKNKDLTTLKVAEVAHTIFYAPQYVAMNKGYFKEEGLNIDLILTPGADKVMASVLSNDVQIGLSGSEATIYVYNGGEKDYVVTFAGLTNKDGAFIVGRNKEDNFKLDNLKGKSVIGGRAGGMPEMTFEWVLRNNGIDPKKDLSINTSVAFPAMAGAFISGIGDYVTLFEPAAREVEKQGFGYVLASVGSLGGSVPYTAYNAKKSYIEKNPAIIEKFNNAINKGLKFVNENDSKTIANEIVSFFPDTSMNDLIAIVERYKGINAWKPNTNITEDEFKLLQDIMKASGELNEIVPYDKLIYSNLFTK